MPAVGWRTPPPRVLGSLAVILFLATAYFTPVPTSDALRSYSYPITKHWGSAAASDAYDPSAPWPSPPPTPAALGARLLTRIDSLLAAPILSYDDSAKKQRRLCPLSHEQSNQDQINGEGDFWREVKSSTLSGKRVGVAARLRMRLGFDASWGKNRLGNAEWKALFGNGERGIVMTGGNGDTAARILTTLKVLRRRHGCELPVEVFAYPDELELGGLRDEIEALGQVSVREIEAGRQNGVWKRESRGRLRAATAPRQRPHADAAHPVRAEFQLKGEAVARSSFTDILYLDSDNVPVRDPTYLFDSPAFREHGYVLWPDFSKDSADNPIWRLTNTNCNPDQWQAESGQVLVSKTARGGMNLAALLVAYEMNADIAFWYKLSGGDKDTFRYATFFLGLAYTAVETYPGSVGSVVNAHDGHTFCGVAMLQHGLAADEWQLPDVQAKLRPGFEPPKQPPPLFMHANLLKHSSGELISPKLHLSPSPAS